MKSVLVIFAVAIATLGMGSVYVNAAINDDVKASQAAKLSGGIETPAQFTYAIQDADNIVTTYNPVAQGNVQTALIGSIETTQFYQGQ